MVRFLTLVLTLALTGPVVAQTKQRIDKEADLPRFSYKLDGRIEDLLRDDAKFRAFVSAVRRDTESTLAKFEIADKAERAALAGHAGTARPAGGPLR